MEALDRVRNLSIIAHIDAGKTSITERMLFYAGRSHRLGEVDDGTTVMDYLEEERARGITIVAAAASFTWQDHLLHLIDTPGHIDFTAEVERALRVIDGAVVIFSAVEGVEAQSEKVWHQADRYHLPRLAFINKLDRVGADFTRTLADINARLGARAVALQWPVGSENALQGLLDLLTGEYLRFGGEYGEQVAREAIPPDLQPLYQARRQALVEQVADLSNTVAEAYLAGTELSPALLQPQLRRLTLAGRLVPVLAGSARRNFGVQPLLDAVLAYLPSPADIHAIPAQSASDGHPLTVKPDPHAPFAGLIFKVVASPSADLYYLRSYAGTLRLGDHVWVPRTRETIKVKRLLRLYAHQTDPIEEIGPGDIVGLVGPKDLHTGDTLCQRHQALLFEPMTFPEPVLSLALEPRYTRDQERLDQALALLAREDPTLMLGQDPDTGQRLLAGMGELHLEIKVKRLATEHHLAVRHGEPRVSYREGLQQSVIVREDFSKTMGDTELYAGVTLCLQPLPPGEQAFKVSHGRLSPAVPRARLAVAMQAVTDALKTGGNYGYPLIYVAAEIQDLRLDEERSTDGAILAAVLHATGNALRQAGTVLLEPMMRLELLCPEASVGDLSNEVIMRRGQLHQIDELGQLKRLFCEVPLAAMFGFSKALPKVTGGRGSFIMAPHGYAPAPAPVAPT